MDPVIADIAMTNIELKITLRPVKSIRELQTDTSQGWKRRIGQLYFQKLEDGGMVPRVVSEATNGQWITKMVNEGRLYVVDGECVCEQN